MSLTLPLKWHGGKNYLAKKLWEISSPIMHDIVHVGEPFCGGASFVLAGLAQGVQKSFWINDLSRDLTNFWMVLRRKDDFEKFRELCEKTPFSEFEWDSANLEFLTLPIFDEKISDRIVRAWRFFVHCRQSMAGRRESFAPLSRTRTRRGRNEQVSAWLTAIEGLPDVHNAIKNVVILGHLDGTEAIKQQDSRTSFFYVDPPYAHETRISKDVYEHEMTKKEHEGLLECLSGIAGKFMLSGYDCSLYQSFEKAEGWRRIQFDLPNNSASGKEKERKTEVVWCNF